MAQSSDTGLRVVAGLDLQSPQVVQQDATRGEKPPPPPPPPPPRDPTLKFRAKRINEHVKSVYSVANTLGAAIIGAAFIIPAVTKGPNGPDLDAPGWCLIGLVLISGGHAAIWRFMRSEE